MDQDKIGNFIKSIRLEKNLTQKEFADILGVTYQAVSKWENGKNVPDIGVMKQICDEFNINMDEIINGEKETPKKNNHRLLFILVSIVLVIVVITSIIIINQPRNVEITTISSKCSDFKITGVAAYNKSKTAISITKIEFCGKTDNSKYKEITCTLYEREQSTRKEISSCKTKNNITLEDYISDISIQVDNYSTMCKKLTSNTLLLEIYAKDENNKTTTYTIPIKINDKCK